jgi:hypothetical protein
LRELGSRVGARCGATDCERSGCQEDPTRSHPA